MKKRIALLAALTVVLGGVFASIGAASTTSTQAIHVITVTATDFHFKIVGGTGLKHGVKYEVKFINKGAALHNFDIQGVKANKVIGHGKSEIETIIFKRKGSFSYLCDVPRHAELGMAGTLHVG